MSGNPAMYQEIIEPLGHKAKQRNDEFESEYGKVVNRFTREFLERFCRNDDAIDWEAVVAFNSSIEKPRRTQTK